LIATAFLSLFAIVGLVLYGLPLYYDFFVRELGWTRARVTSGNMIGKILIGPLFGFVAGWMIDRFGRRPILIAGPLLTAGAALLTGVAQTFPELLVYRFLDGWAAQMWLLARLAGISQQSSAGQRGRRVTWMYAMDNVGRLSGPLAGGVLAAALGPRSPFVAYAALSLLALLTTFRLTHDPPIRRAVAGVSMSLGRASLREIVLPRLAFFGVAFFSAAARGPMYANMLHLYAAFAYNLDAAGIGILATTASTLGIPIGFASGWLMDRFGRKVTMVPGFTGVTITMLLLAVTAFLGLPLVWYVAAFLAAVVAQSLTGGSIQTVGADVAPPHARGTFLGLWRFTGQGGQTLSPLAFGILAERTGYGTSFVFVAAAAFITALLLLTLVPETSRRPK
jgi:MFS family permease